MPELPEVETVVRVIRPAIQGRTIRGVLVNWERTVDRPSAKGFSKILQGQKVLEVTRRAKYIVIKLSGGWHLICHLRMSGDLVVVRSSEQLHKHTRAIFDLGRGRDLRFIDQRKFGKLYLVRDIEEISSKLGPEPLEKHFSPEAFHERLLKHKGSIKPVLLNQSVIAGLGNIYVNETLWGAGIHPLRPANSLSLTEVSVLLRVIRKVLTKAIAGKGTDLGDGVWEYGGYKAKVHGRQGQKCPKCRHIITHMVVAQRGTDFCAKCQPI